MKAASSLPQVFSFAEDCVQSFAPLHSATCHKGFLYIDGQVNLFNFR